MYWIILVLMSCVWADSPVQSLVILRSFPVLVVTQAPSQMWMLGCSYWLHFALWCLSWEQGTLCHLGFHCCRPPVSPPVRSHFQGCQRWFSFFHDLSVCAAEVTCCCCQCSALSAERVENLSLSEEAVASICL